MQDSSGVEPRPGYGSGSDLPATDLVDGILERDLQEVVEICDLFGRVARLGGVGLEDECELDRGHADHEIKRGSVRQQHADFEDDRINRECNGHLGHAALGGEVHLGSRSRRPEDHTEQGESAPRDTSPCRRRSAGGGERPGQRALYFLARKNDDPVLHRNDRNPWVDPSIR